MDIPLVDLFRTSFANVKVVGSVLVGLSSSGITRWGESACWNIPSYCAECSSTKFIIAQEFIAPLLLNQNITSGAELQKSLSGLKDNYFAKAAFDLAWWDLHAQRQKQPLWKILGGHSDSIEAGADFGIMDNIKELLDAIKKAKDQGYKRVKPKYKPGWDLKMIKEVRNMFLEIPIHIDCNSCYSLKDINMFKELDNDNLTMIEQPLAHDDLLDHASLQRELNTPICLDESIVSADKARKAIQLKACGWINIKLGRVVGITNALEINKMYKKYHIPCWVGGLLESAIGSSHNMAFATLSNIKYPSDIFPTSRFYHKNWVFPR